MCSFKSGKIIALKSSCDYFITYLRRPKKLTFEEVKDIHSRGLITQEEIAYEWEMNNYCPVDNERLCSMFDTCHDCLLSYSCARSEYEHYKEDNNYMYVRKRTMKK